MRYILKIFSLPTVVYYLSQSVSIHMNAVESFYE
jgi:hypothetical protein